MLVGGCVRDMIVGVAPLDYDIATAAPPSEVARLFSDTRAVGEAFGVLLVIEPEGVYEVATFRKDGPYLDGRRPVSVEFSGEREDAMRRDFTVNALFYDPHSRRVIDYVAGRYGRAKFAANSDTANTAVERHGDAAIDRYHNTVVHGGYYITHSGSDGRITGACTVVVSNCKGRSEPKPGTKV